jgi:hypothetical protein
MCLHIKENMFYLREYEQGENAIICLKSNKTHTTSIQGNKNKPLPRLYEQKHILIKTYSHFRPGRPQRNTSVEETHLHITSTSRQKDRNNLYTFDFNDLTL